MFERCSKPQVPPVIARAAAEDARGPFKNTRQGAEKHEPLNGKPQQKLPEPALLSDVAFDLSPAQARDCQQGL